MQKYGKILSVVSLIRAILHIFYIFLPNKKDIRTAFADEIEVFMVNYSSKAFKVARYAIMLAIIFIATLLDRVITLGLPIAGATVELIVTFALCFLFNSWIDGLIASVFMGLSSFILAFPFAKVASQNPLISIVPRLFVSILAFCVYRLILLLTNKLNNKILAQTIAMVPATFAGLITNTVLYMGALTLFTDAYGSLVLALQAVAILNVLPEYLVALLGVAPLVLGVRRGLKLGRDGNNWKRLDGKPADIINGSPQTETEQSADTDEENKG